MLKFSAITLFVLILCLSVFGQSTSPVEQKEKTEPVEAKPIAIPLIQITEKADETQQQLQDLYKDIEPSKDFAEFEKDLPLILDSLKKLQTNKILKELDDKELRVLNSLHQEWNLYHGKLEDGKARLLSASQNVEGKLQFLKELQNVWQLTKNEAQKEKAPRALKSRVTAILNEIAEADKKVSKRLNDLLILQNTVSKSQSEINETVKKITEAESNLRGNIFVRDSPPLWEVWQARQDTVHIAGQFQKSWTEIFRSNLAFINVNVDRFYIHLFVTVLLLIVMLFISQKNKKNLLLDEDDQFLKDSAFFISRPVSAALLISLFCSIWIYPEYPAPVGEFLLLLLLIPVIRLVKGIFMSDLRISVYILAIIYVFDILQKNAVGYIGMQRMLLFIATIAILVLLFWLIRPHGPLKNLKLSGLPKYLFRSLYVAIFFLFVSLVANIYGSVALAKTLTWGLVESSHLLVTIYITVSVSSGLVTVLIRRRRTRAMQFVRTYAFKLEQWARLAISLTGLYIWTRATLNVFTLLDPLKSWFQDLRATTWTVGNVVISIDVILDFILIIIFTFIIARLIRVFMDLEVFPKLKLPKGLPDAINMMVRYILVALGIFLAFSSLGIDLGNFGVLAGALGVGLGFGLQKIVANFISSLIIAFSRAIRVGDSVQYQDVTGNVKEIGVNASTVRTFDGSDVIIPNSDLISNKVTNWTLKDTQRRMMLPVKVAFGYNPHEVLKILEQVARDYDDVFDSPEPFGVFKGFGDNYLDFSLYYWIPTSLFFEAQSKIALAAHDAITARGIQTPRPQRDVWLSAEESANARQIPVKVKTARSSRAKKQSPGSKSSG